MMLTALALLLAAQDSLSWRAAASYGFEAFTDSRSPWHAATLALSRHGPRLTAIAQADAYRRFDITDVAAVADVYTVFRRGTYAEWRVQWAPDAEVVAQTEAGLELFHSPAQGWELSAAYRHGKYAASAVDIAGASAARYAGDWYLRLRGGRPHSRAGPTGCRSLFSRAGSGETPMTLLSSTVDSAKTSSPWGRGRLTSRPRRSSPRAGNGA